MRRALSIAVLMVLALPVQAAAAKPRCRLPAKATAIATNSLATLYSVPRRFDPPIYRACLRASGRKLLIQPRSDPAPENDPEVHDITLAGRYVGWVEILNDRYRQSRGSVHVFDLRRGKIRWVGGGPYRPVLGEPPEVTDLALSETGRVAYITREYRIEYPEPDGRPSEWRTLWVTDAGGSRTLEEGRDSLDLTSLEISGLTLTWTSAGQARSAQLH